MRFRTCSTDLPVFQYSNLAEENSFVPFHSTIQTKHSLSMNTISRSLWIWMNLYFTVGEVIVLSILVASLGLPHIHIVAAPRSSESMAAYVRVPRVNLSWNHSCTHEASISMYTKYINICIMYTYCIFICQNISEKEQNNERKDKSSPFAHQRLDACRASFPSSTKSPDQRDNGARVLQSHQLAVIITRHPIHLSHTKSQMSNWKRWWTYGLPRIFSTSLRRCHLLWPCDKVTLNSLESSIQRYTRPTCDSMMIHSPCIRCFKQYPARPINPGNCLSMWADSGGSSIVSHSSQSAGQWVRMVTANCWFEKKTNKKHQFQQKWKFKYQNASVTDLKDLTHLLWSERNERKKKLQSSPLLRKVEMQDFLKLRLGMSYLPEANGLPWRIHRFGSQ